MRHIKTALLVLVFFSVLAGIVYPLVITGVARLLFPRRAGGSLITADGRVVGSELIGQGFVSVRYFRGRPSACGWDAANSAASNLGPANPKLIAMVRERIDSVRVMNGLPDTTHIPADLVLASGSGLDPDISPQSALLQAERVARARSLDPATVRDLVLRHTEHPFLGIFGPERVNVLILNLALDSISPAGTP
jgi:K+-transporting ATPase ATPase C chain